MKNAYRHHIVFLACGIVLSTSALLGCKHDISLTLKSDPGETLYFGDALGGATWLGRPVFVDANGKASVGMYGTVVPWAERCSSSDPSNLERTQALKQRLQDNFGVVDLREFIKNQPDLWNEIRGKRLILQNPQVTADQFASTFQDDQKKTLVRMLFPILKNPSLQVDMEPAASLGFSRTSFSGSASAGITQQFTAGLTAEQKTLHAVIVSRSGQMSLDDFSRACLVAAAKSLDPKPSYVVDSISLGVLFQFDIEVQQFAAVAGGEANEVKLSGRINSDNVRINAALYGAVKPTSTSLFDLYSSKNKTPADVQILSHFADFADHIETPVFVSAHLTPVP